MFRNRHAPKSFVTVVKGRRSGQPLPTTNFKTNIIPDDPFGENGDEKPPRDINDDISDQPSDDGYEAALRAADVIFTKRDSQPSPSQPNHPFQPSPQQSSPPPASSSVAHAESFFRKPSSPDASPIVVAEAPVAPADDRRILPDMSARDELQERLDAANARRRGRRPGSKNKPKTDIVAIDASSEVSVPKRRGRPPRQDRVPAVIEAKAPQRRGRKPGSKNKPKVLPIFEPPKVLAAVVPYVPPAPRPATQPHALTSLLVSSAYRRNKGIKVKPGEEWKARRLKGYYVG